MLLILTQKDFDSMVIEKKYGKRLYKKLDPGVYQKKISDLIWDKTHMKCGFDFKYHHLSWDLMTGSIKG